MELVPQDALLFIVSYLKGRREPEVRSALVDAVAAAYDRRLELPYWVLDLLGDDTARTHAALLELFGPA